MAPSSDDTNHRHEQYRPERLSAQTVHDLQGPLTVIKGQAQLLERWVRRNDIPNADAVLARLAVIDRMVARLVAELDERRRANPPAVDAEDRS